MAKTRYENRKFTPERAKRIEVANDIIATYAAQGMTLTLRQLYYQHVARDLIPNNQKEYNRLGELCRDARMAGLMDWNALIDRPRNLQSMRTFDSPKAVLEDVAKRYLRDMWAPQGQRVEVWIEKDAAIGVVEDVCRENSIPFFSTRGYASMSEFHDAAQRIRWHMEQGNQVTILHIGDHDPSGVDMTRDIEDRLRTFIHRDWVGLHMVDGVPYSRGAIRQDMRDTIEAARERKGIEAAVDIQTQAPWAVNRIALTYPQVEQYDPPPNFAKESDARFKRYFDETGLTDSWELDALEPVVLQDLILDAVEPLRNEAQWGLEEHQMEAERAVLLGVGNWWDDVAKYLDEKGKSA